jgi:hypothetical protein
VTDAGTFRFPQRLLYLANALLNQHIGLEETETARGRSTSTPCSSRRSTSASSSSAGNPRKCYPCPPTVLLPISPAAQRVEVAPAVVPR